MPDKPDESGPAPEAPIVKPQVAPPKDKPLKSEGFSDNEGVLDIDMPGADAGGDTGF